MLFMHIHYWCCNASVWITWRVSATWDDNACGTFFPWWVSCSAAINCWPISLTFVFESKHVSIWVIYTPPFPKKKKLHHKTRDRCDINFTSLQHHSRTTKLKACEYLLMAWEKEAATCLRALLQEAYVYCLNHLLVHQLQMDADPLAYLLFLPYHPPHRLAEIVELGRQLARSLPKSTKENNKSNENKRREYKQEIAYILPDTWGHCTPSF